MEIFNMCSVRNCAARFCALAVIVLAEIKRSEAGMSQATGVLTGHPTDGVGLLSKERIIAGPAFNRWLVPPAALAIHLCIGMAYGFSVFWLPLARALNGKEAIACPPDMPLFGAL